MPVRTVYYDARPERIIQRASNSFDLCTITFPAVSGATYLIFACSDIDANFQGTGSNLIIHRDGVGREMHRHIAPSIRDFEVPISTTFMHVFIATATENVTYRLKVDFDVATAANGFNTIGAAQSTLTILRLLPGDFVFPQVALARTTSNVYTPYQASIIPAGAATYLMLMSVGFGNVAKINEPRGKIRCAVGSLPDFGECWRHRNSVGSDGVLSRWAYFMPKVLTVAGGETARFLFASMNGLDEVVIQGGVIAGLKLSNFEAVQYSENLDDIGTTSQTSVQKNSLSFRSEQSRYIVIDQAISAPSSVATSFFHQEYKMRRNSVDTAGVMRHYTKSGGDYQDKATNSKVRLEETTPGGVFYSQQQRSNHPSLTSHLRDAGIYALQLDITTNIAKVTQKDRIIIPDTANSIFVPGKKPPNQKESFILGERASRTVSIRRMN